MEKSSQPEAAAETQEPRPKSVKRVEHFWLCGPCSANLTLASDGQHGVKIIPKKFQALAAAS